jgi:hypothetical protein
MAEVIRFGSARIRLVGATAALLLALAMAAFPALAAPSASWATFNETTTFRKCPPGLPSGAQCYTGIGHGPVTPAGDPNATEYFAGYVVFDPTTGAGPDYNLVQIVTRRGTLYLTTQGFAQATGPLTSVENGTWTARGGTEIFEGASGSGPVSTVGTINPSSGTISSLTNYGGTLNLGTEH